MRPVICKVKSRSSHHSRGIVPLSQQAWESPSHQPPFTFGKENATTAAAAEVPWINYMYYALIVLIILRKDVRKKPKVHDERVYAKRQYHPLCMWSQSLIMPYSKFVALLLIFESGTSSPIPFGSVLRTMRSSHRHVLLSSFFFSTRKHTPVLCVCVTPS